MSKCFCVVKISQKRGIFSRKRIKYKHNCKIDYIEITLPKRCSKTYLSAVAKTVYPKADVAVFSQKMTSQPNMLYPIKPFSSHTALSDLTAECAVKILRKNHQNAVNMTVCFADRSGRYVKTAEALMKNCKTLKVLTENCFAYYKAADSIFAKCGAEPVICSHAGKCDVVIVPSAHCIYLCGKKYTLSESSVSVAQTFFLDETDYCKRQILLAYYQKNRCFPCDDVRINLCSCEDCVDVMNVRLECAEKMA